MATSFFFFLFLSTIFIVPLQEISSSIPYFLTVFVATAKIFVFPIKVILSFLSHKTFYILPALTESPAVSPLPIFLEIMSAYERLDLR